MRVITLVSLTLFCIVITSSTYADTEIDEDIIFATQLIDLAPIDRVIAIMERKVPNEDWDINFDEDVWLASLNAIEEDRDRFLADFAYLSNFSGWWGNYEEISFHLLLAVLYKNTYQINKLDALFKDFQFDSSQYYKRLLLKEYYALGIEFYSETKVDLTKLEGWSRKLNKWGVKDKFKIPGSLFFTANTDYHYVSAKSLLGIILYQQGKEKDGKNLIIDGAKEYIKEVLETGSYGISADELLYLAHIYSIEGRSEMADLVFNLNEKMKDEFALQLGEFLDDEIRSWKALSEWAEKRQAFIDTYPVYGARLKAIDEELERIDSVSETVYQQIAGRIRVIYDLNLLWLIFLADNIGEGLEGGMPKAQPI